MKDIKQVFMTLRIDLAIAATSPCYVNQFSGHEGIQGKAAVGALCWWHSILVLRWRGVSQSGGLLCCHGVINNNQLPSNHLV